MHIGSVPSQHRRDLPVREQRPRQALSNPGAMLDNPAPGTYRSAIPPEVWNSSGRYSRRRIPT